MRRITIHNQLPSGEKATLATQELSCGLRALFPEVEISPAGEETRDADTVSITLVVDASRFKDLEAYEIARTDRGVTLTGATPQAALFAVFDLLERQGVVFALHGPIISIDRGNALLLPEVNAPWTASPQFGVRGLLPWPDFLNCISVYNTEDFKAYFANMLRMRMNMFGMHVYPDEAYLSFDFAGSGHRAWLEHSAMTTWGYKPQRTSTYKMGAAEFYDREVFGSDAQRTSNDLWEIARLTTEMLRASFSYAATLGIRTGIGFEPHSVPDEILKALPPESAQRPGGLSESPIGRDLLERRLADLLDRYPMVDDVWLWEFEGGSWGDGKTASTTYFDVAHDFLRRHAPSKRLVLAGWGWVAASFPQLHEKLPEDIIFSSLGGNLGWDPVSENFGKLGSRERWPIPWLEDDPSMWFPQFRASTIERDVRLAQQYGCQGMLGIHWRHRIVDPVLTYLARGAWDGALTATEHYKRFSAVQASGGRAERLATLFGECDEGHKVLSTQKTWTSPDFGEAFGPQKIDAALLDAQRGVAQKFQALSHEASSPTEQERLNYFAGYVGLTVPYCDAMSVAADLETVLGDASKLRTDGKADDARAKVSRDGVPIWLKLAPLVRQTMLTYQPIVSERVEQGQLASMQNKLVRIALDRMRLALKEFLGDLPPEVDRAYADAIAADPAAPRAFLPTRPSIAKSGESVRLAVVVPGGGANCAVQAYTRRGGTSGWNAHAARHLARSVYEIVVGPFQAQDGPIEYYVSATIPGGDTPLVAPPGGANEPYWLTVI